MAARKKKPKLMEVAIPVLTPFVYHAFVERVKDGDTVVITIDQGFKDKKHEQDMRLYGYNSNEKGTPAGEAAKEFLKGLVEGKEVILQTLEDKTEKYGRWLGNLFLDGVYINAHVVNSGHGIEWYGQGERPV